MFFIQKRALKPGSARFCTVLLACAGLAAHGSALGGGGTHNTWVILEAHNGYIIHTEYIVCTEIRAEVGTEHILYRKGQK